MSAIPASLIAGIGARALGDGGHRSVSGRSVTNWEEHEQGQC